MKKAYEVSYYEYGLTKIKRKRFYFFLTACLFKLHIDFLYDKSAYATIKGI